MCFLLESLGAVGSSSTRIVCFLRELGMNDSLLWEPLDQAVVDCVFPLRAWEPLDQAVHESCVSFESLGAVLDQAVRRLNIYIKFIHSSNKKSNAFK